MAEYLGTILLEWVSDSLIFTCMCERIVLFYSAPVELIFSLYISFIFIIATLCQPWLKCVAAILTIIYFSTKINLHNFFCSFAYVALEPKPSEDPKADTNLQSQPQTYGDTAFPNEGWGWSYWYTMWCILQTFRRTYTLVSVFQLSISSFYF